MADAFAETPTNGQREQLPGVDILYLKNVLLKFLDSAAAGRTEQVCDPWRAHQSLLWAFDMIFYKGSCRQRDSDCRPSGLCCVDRLRRKLQAEGSGIAGEARLARKRSKQFRDLVLPCPVLCSRPVQVLFT